jgi:hypothetical protein
MYAPDCPEAQEAWDKYHDYAHKECVGDHGLRLLSSEKMIIGQFTVFVYERSKPRGVVTAGSSSSRLHRLRIF